MPKHNKYSVNRMHRTGRTTWAVVWLAVAANIMLAVGCAKQGFPNGGPKDTAPPTPVACKPANESRNFNSRQFFIEFDEYVVLKDVANNVLISPPMASKPEFSTKGHGVLVKLTDTLLPQTTYLFQFKEAIADFTEGNTLPSFEYVFSTGSNMDTLVLGGTVLNERNGKPWHENVSVLAYKEERFTTDSTDTIATYQQPDFITRTDKQGRFALNYIPAGQYRLVAIADANRNLRADNAEAVAWASTPYSAMDSIDTTAGATLLISQPDRRQQRLLKAEFTEPAHLVATTLLPMVAPTLAGADSIVYYLHSGGDTLEAWLPNQNTDSALLVIIDTGLCDTLKLRYRAPSARGRMRGNVQQAARPLMFALCDGQRAYYDELPLGFTTPVTETGKPLQASVMRLSDSTVSTHPLLLDSTGMRATIDARLQSGEKYAITLRDSLFRSIYGKYTDSLRFQLTPKDYSTLLLHVVNNTGKQLVIELLDERDTVVQHRTVVGTAADIRFIHIAEATYRIRAVIDADANGQWTPGDYRLQRQPEACVMFPKELQLREKWEIEERWQVGDEISVIRTQPALHSDKPHNLPLHR